MLRISNGKYINILEWYFKDDSAKFPTIKSSGGGGDKNDYVIAFRNLNDDAGKYY